MNIFQRGDYRAFIVVAPADDMNRVLFAFPVFEGQEVSDVFNYYKNIYISDKAVIKLVNLEMDDPRTLGKVFADVSVGVAEFIVSTVTSEYDLWFPVVKQWEDQWVFDHIVATTGEMPDKEARKFKGGLATQNMVESNYEYYLKRYWLAATVIFIVAMIMSSSKRTDDQ